MLDFNKLNAAIKEYREATVKELIDYIINNALDGLETSIMASATIGERVGDHTILLPDKYASIQIPDVDDVITKALYEQYKPIKIHCAALLGNAKLRQCVKVEYNIPESINNMTVQDFGKRMYKG